MSEELVPLLIIGMYAALLVLERVFPARPLPKVRFWLAKGLFFFVMTMAVNTIVPALVAAWVGPHAPLSLASRGTAFGALAAFVTAQLVSYWVHRTYHRFPVLWRWTHQLHHSAERVDIAGATFFHPFDIAGQAGAQTAAVALLGVSPEAAALAGIVGVFYALFQHANLRTPRWLGYLIQRPESHSVHHQRGVHAYNYGDLPLWDLVFGTFRNPATFAKEAGFWDGASSKVSAMLLGRDLGEPPGSEMAITGAR